MEEYDLEQRLEQQVVTCPLLGTCREVAEGAGRGWELDSPC